MHVGLLAIYFAKCTNSTIFIVQQSIGHFLNHYNSAEKEKSPDVRCSWTIFFLFTIMQFDAPT